VIRAQPIFTVKVVKLFVEMACWMSARNVTTESITPTLFLTVVEPTVFCGTVVMEFWMLWKNVIMVRPMLTNQTLVDLGVAFLSVVMVSSTWPEVSNVTMEILLMETVATVVVNPNAAMDTWTPTKFATLER